MSKPDTIKFFENLSGAGKAIAVLTSGGDAQGTVSRDVSQKSCLVPIYAHFVVYEETARLYVCVVN